MGSFPPEEHSCASGSFPPPRTARHQILFPEPQHLRRIWLEFTDPDHERTQEFLLRWSGDGGGSFQEIVRQQWNFSPQGATTETEDVHVDLAGVTVLELTIRPDISGGGAPARLARMRLA